jgi:type IV pilus assembly protein PilX
MVITQPKSQKGIVLVVSLIMLLLLTLLGVSGMKSTILEEKMAGNYKDKNMAFQSAEAALRAGETYLRTTVTLPLFDGATTGLYQPTTTGASRWDTVTWSDAGQVIAYAGTLSDVADAPNYIIEELAPVPSSGGSKEAGTVQEHKYYRITAQAVGGTVTAVVRLQSTYKR